MLNHRVRLQCYRMGDGGELGYGVAARRPEQHPLEPDMGPELTRHASRRDRRARNLVYLARLSVSPLSHSLALSPSSCRACTKVHEGYTTGRSDN